MVANWQYKECQNHKEVETWLNTSPPANLVGVRGALINGYTNFFMWKNVQGPTTGSHAYKLSPMKPDLDLIKKLMDRDQLAPIGFNNSNQAFWIVYDSLGYDIAKEHPDLILDLD